MERIKQEARRWAILAWGWIKGLMGEMSPRRALAFVVALSLWMGAGGMTASVRTSDPSGEVFGEVHWYNGGR